MKLSPGGCWPRLFFWRRCLTARLFYLVMFLCQLSSVLAGGGALEMRHGYFWDPARGEYFVPRGVAYQIWNPPVGANQSFDQVDYDLLEIKKIRANSLRVEMTWSQIEVGPSQYDWSKPDHLIKKAEELGLKLFVIIGYQYPPTSWFPTNWHGINSTGILSDVINYEDSQAREVYRKHIATVTARYKDSTAIGAWILGNEYAYFDLWEDPNLYPVHRFLGYDPVSQTSFRNYLQSIYQTNIAALNANWAAAYRDFNSVEMPVAYPVDRHLPAYHDLIQWRKQSIGSFVALGAAAAKAADPNHLRTYSMVGGIFNGRDANYTCEDARTIVASCRGAGAPLDFWSINNYAWTAIGSEMRSASFGIGKYQAEAGLPVMISETGHSSTESLFDLDPVTGYSYSGARQPQALPSTLWESLLSGAIGAHFFTWNDRSQFTQAYFYRERGFGIVRENREPKQPVYNNIVSMFRQMEQVRLDQVLGGSRNPPPDVQYFWSTNADMVWPRANQENAMLWGALKRLGLQPGVIDDQAFERGAWSNAPALLLARAYQMNPTHLRMLAGQVLPAGINIHADADLPGQFDAYGRTNPDWGPLMRDIFGIDVTKAALGIDLDATGDCYSPIHLAASTPLGPIAKGYVADLTTWKFWRNVNPAGAQVILNAFGFPDIAQSNANCPYLDTTHYPALLVNSVGSGRGRSAINVFALGDAYSWSGTPATQWETRSTILRAIYRDHFGLKPAIDLSGPGSGRVLSTYRFCENDSVLICLLNEDTNAAVLTITAPGLFSGRKIEDLTSGGVLTQNSNGTLTYTNRGDECAVLYAFKSNGQADDSLVNPSPDKLWFQDAPDTISPGPVPAVVRVACDTQDTNLVLRVTLEQISPRSRIYGQSIAVSVRERDSVALELSAIDADPNDPEYISSAEGGQYVFHAVLTRGEVPVSEMAIPVHLVFGIHPTQPFPSAITQGRRYDVELAWEELPSYLSNDLAPLDRAALWNSLGVGEEHYNVVLELRSAGQVVATNSYLTSKSTDSHLFSITVPSRAGSPFTWTAYVQKAKNVLSHNVAESFEGYERGAKWSSAVFLTNVNFLAPWQSYNYAFPPTNLWLNEGVQLEGSDGSQSAFIVATNMSWLAVGTFGISYVFTNGDWALPADRAQWTNYLFSYDFKESHGYACSVEMQVKNVDTNGLGNWIQYTNLWNKGSTSWMTVKASLDQFLPPPGLSGVFDPSHVHEIVLNINMLTPDVQYVGSFDNIRFTGPEINQGGGEIAAVYTSANDSAGWLSVQYGPLGPSISWIGPGILQTANDLGGTWTDVANASNPWRPGALARARFYRLRR